MPSRPVAFIGTELQKLGDGALDPLVLPSTVVTTDGVHPFTAPQSGVAPTLPGHLTTSQWVLDNAGSVAWQAPVLSATTTAQPGHVPGARYLVPASATGADWAGQDGKIAIDSGTAWSFVTPVSGYVLRATDTGIFRRYSGGAWADLSLDVDHSALKSLQGGTSSERYHLTLAEHDAVSGSKTTRFVFAAPTGGPGAMVARALDVLDIQSGIFGGARGGLGVNASAASGYAKWTAGSVAFSATIPWVDVVPPVGGFTPATHAISHQSGGTDALALDATQITTGQLSQAQGGTGLDTTTSGARTALLGPTVGTGPLTLRVITPDDVSGASVALQFLQRNSGNTANVWAIFNPAANGAVPSTRTVSTSGYLAGGGALSADLTLTWVGVDVALAGVVAGRRPKINFTGAGVTVTDDAGGGQAVVNIPGQIGLSPIVAAIVFGS